MKREIKIGIFTVLTIAGAWGGLRFLSGTNLFSNYKNYYAKYEQVSGLQQASNIYIRGVKVGSVSKIILNTTDDAGVKIVLSLEGGVKIPTDSKAKIAGDGLMSSKSIEIVLGTNKEYFKAGQSIPVEASADLLQTASSDLKELSTNLKTATSQLTQTLSLVNNILETNSELINSALTNLDSLSMNVNRLVEPETGNISKMSLEMAEMAESLNQSASKVDSLLVSLNSVAEDFEEAKLGEALTQTLGEVDAITKQINSQQGTIGKVLYDETLYANMSAATASLDSLFIDIKEHPSRYVNFSVFGGGDSKKAQRKAEKAKKEAQEQIEKEQDKAAKKGN